MLRLPETGGFLTPKVPLDQFGTFEIFVRPKEGKPFQHEGSLHAPDLELAFVLGKEAFTRRFSCESLFVVDTRDVFVSQTTEGTVSVYDGLPVATVGGNEVYEIFHLMKRGKQHVHAGSVRADSVEDALSVAKATLGQKTVYNVWVIPQNKIRYTRPEENDMWLTLPEKRFRDAADYKGGDKLKDFLETRI